MCGEIEEENRYQAGLFQRFLVHARDVLSPKQAGAANADSLNAYLDGLLADVLQRCANDAQALAGDDAYHRMAMQSVVLARLAGFIAGHVALNEDPMRKIIEAVMLGYGEAEMAARAHDHHPGHGHDHDHEHGHHHGHHGHDH